jgi:hypothetical protein
MAFELTSTSNEAVCFSKDVANMPRSREIPVAVIVALLRRLSDAIVAAKMLRVQRELALRGIAWPDPNASKRSAD